MTDLTKVTVEDVDPRAPDEDDIPEGAAADAVGGTRVLADELGATELSLNRYRLDPGESFTVSFHRHEVQEELFYVLSGTVTLRTVPHPDGEGDDDGTAVDVGAGEVVRVPPGTFQLGTNRGDEPVEALALGAPKEYQSVTEWLVACEACGEDTVHVFEPGDGDEFVYRCTDCDGVTERVST